MKKQIVRKNVEFGIGVVGAILSIIFVISGCFAFTGFTSDAEWNAYIALIGTIEVLMGLGAGVISSFFILPVFGLNSLEKVRCPLLALILSGGCFLERLITICFGAYTDSTSWIVLFLFMIAVGSQIVGIVFQDKDFYPYVIILGSTAMVTVSIMTMVGVRDGVTVIYSLSLMLLFIALAILPFFKEKKEEQPAEVKSVDESDK